MRPKKTGKKQRAGSNATGFGGDLYFENRERGTSSGLCDLLLCLGSSSYKKPEIVNMSLVDILIMKSSTQLKYKSKANTRHKEKVTKFEKERQTYRQTNRLKTWSIKESMFQIEQRRLQYLVSSGRSEIRSSCKMPGYSVKKSVLRTETMEGCD